MFGYIKPCLKCLSEEDQTLFKSYYCGVCKSLSKRYTQFSRMTLSYDATFLAVFLDAFFNDLEIIKGRCVVVREKEIGISGTIDFAADVNVLLSYHNLRDDCKDKKSAKASLAKHMLTTAYKKAKNRLPKIDEHIDSSLVHLWQLESEKCNEPDVVANSFGRLLEGVVALYSPEFNTKDVRAVAYNLGRWIYLMDAVDDYEKDILQKNYNVLYLKYGKLPIKEVCEKMRFNIEFSLASASEAYENLNITKNKGVLDNIMYKGTIMKFNAMVLKEQKNESL